MGGKQRPTPVGLVQVLHRRPGDRQPVIGGRAATDFVEDDKRTRAGLIEDRGGFDHFDHEGRAASGKIVGRAHPAVQSVNDADAGAICRHIGADLRQNGNQRVLSQEGAFAGHIGAGQQP